MNSSIIKTLRFLSVVMFCSIDSNLYANFILPTIEGIEVEYAIDFSSGECYVYKVPTSATGVCTIPKAANGQDVKAIGREAFKECRSLTNITIPNSVQHIVDYAFVNCVGLTSITIPNSVISIGRFVFDGCTNLTSITIPKSVTSIDEGMLTFCESLTRIVVEESNPKYDSRNDCNAIIETASNEIIAGCMNTIIPNSVTSIGNSAFLGCNLSSIIIPSSIKNIGNQAFYGCKSLTCVTILCMPTQMGSDVFNGCQNLKEAIFDCETITYILRLGEIKSLEKVTMTESVTTIDNYSFERCVGLTSITIPNSVTSIGKSAFRSCTSLTNISLSNSLQTIDEQTFMGCSSLKSITFPNSLKTINYNAFYGCTSLTSLIIPNSVTYIDSYAFGECKGLTEVILSNSLLSINSNLFSGCINLTKVNIPNSVKDIGDGAFSYCSSLTSITIPNSVSSIGQSVFAYCSNLMGIFIPNSVKKIDSRIFQGCTELASIVVEDGNPVYDSRDNCNAIIKTATNILLFGCKNTIIPHSVIELESEALSDCVGMINLFIPNSLVKIGIQNLPASKDMMSIVVEDGHPIYDSRDNCNAIIETATNTLIYGCRNTIIPSSITSIGNGAFRFCSNLTNITIPNLVTSVNWVAFGDCTELASIVVEDGNPVYDSRDNCNAIIETATNTLIAGCKNTIIPYSVKNIGKYAFDGCSSLSEILIPHSVRNIESFAFGRCQGLKKVISKIIDPFDIVGDAFYKISAEAVLEVPKGTKEMYSANASWVKHFKELVEDENYYMSISAFGGGEVLYNGEKVCNGTIYFPVIESSTATLSIIPGDDFLVKSVKVNQEDVTMQLLDNQYQLHITANANVIVEFIEDMRKLTHEGLIYTITSEDGQTLNLRKGNYGQMLTVPAQITTRGKTWTVVGVEEGALMDNTDLAAIIWNPEAMFNGRVSNPNLLLYVKSAEYASNEIRNVVVNGIANNITLTDAVSSNNFYCPQTFMANRITYEHNYSMKSGYKNCQGWETIALPYDVSAVISQTGTDMVPYSTWTVGSTKRPFWLYELTAEGWKAATAILANTPYIISMPNNENYDADYNIAGKVVFTGTNVQVKASDELAIGTYGQKRLVPNFQRKESEGIYALNVNNEYSRNPDGSYLPGSTFLRNSRPVYPFEAYLTVEGSAARAIPIFDGNGDTGIGDALRLNNNEGVNNKVFNLNGQRVQAPGKGLYIVNGRKVVMK